MELSAKMAVNLNVSKKVLKRSRILLYPPKKSFFRRCSRTNVYFQLKNIFLKVALRFSSLVFTVNLTYQTMQFWLTAVVTLLLAGVCSVNGLDAVLNDTCGAEEISQLACMIMKLDKKLDSIIELVQGKLSFRHGKIPETVLDIFSPM